VGTGGTCLISPSSKKPRACQPGESSGSVAESALPGGGGGAKTDSLSPADDAGKVYSGASAQSLSKYADAVMLFRDGGTAGLGRAVVVVVAFRSPFFLACSDCPTTCSISSTLRCRLALAAEVGGRPAVAVVGSVDCSAACSTITFGACMLPLGILIGAGAARLRGAVTGAGGLGEAGRVAFGNSGVDIGSCCCLGVMGKGTLDDLEEFRRSMREADGEMSRTSSAAAAT